MTPSLPHAGPADFQRHPHYPHLFSPWVLAGHALKNRIVHASISLHFPVHDGVPAGLMD